MALLAYIDEIGQPGAFMSLDHPRYNESPAFGYAGFVIPLERAREFGALFTKKKNQLFPSESAKAEHSGRWEKKGAELIYAKVISERKQNLRVLGSLISGLRKVGGNLFYYAEEKPVGSPKELNTGRREFAERESVAMQETLNRLARHANSCDEPLLVMMDQINEKSRRQRLPEMYAHILGRAAQHEEMRRIIEPPMHIDSKLSSNIQFADWIAALMKRVIEYQLVKDSRYSWLPECEYLQAAHGAFTYESKLHLYHRSIDDIHHSSVLDKKRPLFDTCNGLSSEGLDALSRVWKATIRDGNS